MPVVTRPVRSKGKPVPLREPDIGCISDLARRHRRVLEDMPCPVLQWTEHLPRHYSIDISHSSGRWLGAWGLGPAGDLEKRINHSTKGPGQGQGRGSQRSLAGPKLQKRIRLSSRLLSRQSNRGLA